MPERRQRVRIFTLKNLGVAALVVVVLLVGANLISEARKTRNGEFGALFNRELDKTETVAPRKVEVVTEAPAQVEDRDSGDPLLLAPAAREQQYLGANEITPRTQVVAVPQPPQSQSQPDHGRVGIVGDASGVSVTGSRRVLAGGFGR